MPDAHCSKCCPTKPPKPDVPAPWPWSALVWLAIICTVGTGLYAFVMWAVSSLF
ncbi:hypothetical protein [Streptomyces decoyicus]|uniref:hypothetical protein n=1 Tax=Streptomyces decoyicus TaxID=249567 RepID=UPI0033AAE0C3